MEKRKRNLKQMKTLPDILNKIMSRHTFVEKWFREGRDVICIVIGHKWKYLSDIFGNFRGANVCVRCNRFMSTLDDVEFYHNWEMNYGRFARCHDHSKHE